jgi:tetratricopeptide (TPR) repeat protein
MLMTLPGVLLLLDYWPLRRLGSAPPAEGAAPAPTSFRRLLLEKLPLLAIAAAVAVVTVVARKQTGAEVPLAAIPLSARLATAVAAYGWYVATTIWPWPLAVLYPHPGRNLSVAPALAGALVLLAITTLAGWQARRRPWLLVGWLWFAGCLVPVLGLVQGGSQAWADRFSYWPHIGLFVAAVWGAAELALRLRIPVPVSAAAGVLILAGLTALTWMQVCTWHDTGTLWEHALAVTKDNDRAHASLGRYDLDRQRPDEAAEQFAEAVRIRPDEAEYLYSLGVALLVLGRDDEAAGRFREAVRHSPNHTSAWYNLGVVALRQGQPEAAVRCFRQVLALQPGSADALAGLGLALARAGKWEEAERALKAALRINPTAADAWHGVGLVYLARGSLEEATDALGKAVRCNPGLVSATSDLGRALGRQGQWEQAVYWQRTALRLQEQGEESLERVHGRAPAPDGIPQLVTLRCRLAFARDHVGQHQAAAADYRAALQRAPLWPWKFLARALALATDRDVNRRDSGLAYELAAQAVQGLLVGARGSAPGGHHSSSASGSATART